ncbi:hypothetical protein UFOVP699_76 [uncultured Caudovirales phage]|uniref:Uncharacterized protein n=1 Tax=uncultured Caudovirales phage TaxID=2100421 RepID=A0A6J5NK63_9CAUD|nr:hypothetical protein UFOVP699_76 [uncultured Caudovirales phage]
MTNWIARNKRSIIRAAFLVPILSVAAISISHVVAWYDLANPISWAIYLSIAVEIAAMSAIAASSVKVKGFSVWFVFLIVTLIQFIGNIFFSYTEINIASKEFKDWAELTLPVFDAMGVDTADLVSQRRFLALLEGGLLPLISLTCLHFFIKYGDLDTSDDLKPVPEEDDTFNEYLESDQEEELLVDETMIESFEEEELSDIPQDEVEMPNEEVQPSSEGQSKQISKSVPTKPSSGLSNKVRRLRYRNK